MLRDINLTVASGEVVVVIGPSGGGKSTLCRTINRLETIDNGTIRFEGRPLPEEGIALARLRSEVGMVFQSFNLFAHKTILENVTLGPIHVRKIARDTAGQLGMDLLDRVGIAAHASKYPAQLSGGQQQRTAIARALAMDPKMIYIGLSMTLSALANWLEQRSRETVIGTIAPPGASTAPAVTVRYT